MQSPALTAPANSSESDRGVAGRYSAPLGIKMDSALDTLCGAPHNASIVNVVMLSLLIQLLAR